MTKVLGLVAAAFVAALVLGFGSALGTSTPKASADTTDVVVIGCELIAGAVDGDTTNGLPSDFDTASACGANDEGDAADPLTLPAVCGPVGTCPSIENLAKAIGNEDGVLEASDFRGELDENWDNNQLSTDCTLALGAPTFTTAGLLLGFGCSLDVFVFVNDNSPVTFDAPTGLTWVENHTQDMVCNTDSEASGTTGPGAQVIAGPPYTSTGNILDNDCSDTVSATSDDNNGDGVVLAHLLADTGSRGDVLTVNVTQEQVEQSFDVNIVGSVNDVKLSLVESTIEQSKSTANLVTCTGDQNDTTTPGGLGIPGTSVSDLAAVADPTSTLAYAVATDQDDTVLTRVPVFFSIRPPEDVNEKAAFGVGNVYEEVSGDTFFTLDVATTAAPTAAYVVVCGGKSTGTTTIRATVNILSGAVLSSTDHSDQELTIGGVPSAVGLTASASQIKCDGTETSTITAKVTDSAGNNVADGVPVSFSVVALGTANPINTVTTDGVATSVITPLSNSSAGVTVIVTAGNSDLAAQVQTSILVSCALPLATQPTLAPPVVAPTARTGIGGPDTGNGGYLAQDGSSFPMWTLIVLALGSMTLVAGGAVARRAGK